MTVEVSWSGLKKAAREGSWVFEVVPIKGQPFDESVFDEAVEAANEVHQADIDRFEDANLVWRFESPSGVGFWCEYELSGKQVEDFIGVFVAEVEQRDVRVRIRALRKSYPEQFIKYRDGLCLTLVLNGEPRDPERGLTEDWNPIPADRDAVIDFLLEWCSFDDAKYWLMPGLGTFQVPAASRKRLARQLMRNLHDATRFVAESPNGEFLGFLIDENGVIYVSIGHVQGIDWRQGVSDARLILKQLAAHLVYGGVSRSLTNQVMFSTWVRSIWNRAGESDGRAKWPTPWMRGHSAPLVLGLQLLGRDFPQVLAKPGWRVEALPHGRVLLISENQAAWFEQGATNELLIRAESLFPELVVQR